MVVAALLPCAICRSPLADAINRRLAAGESVPSIQRWLTEGSEHAWHRNVFSKHKNEHLKEPIVRERERTVLALERQRKTIKGPSDTDLARLVRDRVVEDVNSGRLTPTLAEGLRAQEMIDRRAEKQADQQIALVIAQVMSGAAFAALPSGERLALPEPSIEAEYTEVQ